MFIWKVDFILKSGATFSFMVKSCDDSSAGFIINRLKPMVRKGWLTIAPLDGKDMTRTRIYMKEVASYTVTLVDVASRKKKEEQERAEYERLKAKYD